MKLPAVTPYRFKTLVLTVAVQQSYAKAGMLHLQRLHGLAVAVQQSDAKASMLHLQRLHVLPMGNNETMSAGLAW